MKFVLIFFLGVLVGIIAILIRLYPILDDYQRARKIFEDQS